MVLQHFALVPVFTALENIVLGAEPVAALRRHRSRDRTPQARRRWRKELGVDLPLDATVESLGVGDRQRLEIARALYRDAKLLILDEPTAVLTKGEALALYATLRRLADAGTGVVVVTHKMDEVRAHADVVTVMRRGEVLFTRELDRGEGADVDAQVDEVTAAIMGAGRGARRGRETAAASTREAATARRRARSCSRSRDVSVGRALTRRLARRARGRDRRRRRGRGERAARARRACSHGTSRPDRGEVTGASAAVIREDRQVEGLVLDATLARQRRAR